MQDLNAEVLEIWMELLPQMLCRLIERLREGGVVQHQKTNMFGGRRYVGLERDFGANMVPRHVE
mgnify:CR=1 FL=1